MILKTAIIALALSQVVSGAKILFFFGFSTYTDRITVWPLVEALVAKGHEVTFLSPYTPQEKEKNPKVVELHPPALVEVMSAGFGNVLERRLENSHESLWHDFREKGTQVCEAIFKEDESREYFKNAEFDLLIINSLHNECAYGLAYKYSAPFMLFGTSSVFLWQPDTYGFFPETSWIPDVTMKISLPLAFLQRVHNTLHPIYWYVTRHWNDFPEMDKILREALEIKRMPPLEELEKNTSLILQNNHYSIEFARTLPPLFVSVAGLHIQEPGKREPLPKEVEQFVEESEEEGFMYISFGPLVNISSMSDTFQNVLYDVLGSFNIRFVWSWNEPRPEKMPSNVMTTPWVPQQTILAHPKIKGFISHAGLLSVQESVANGVPLVVLPVFMEQDYNAEKVERQGYGIRVEIARLKREGLSDAISNILNEPKYTEKALEMSKLFLDRPMKPLETAVWWTEYVLRHKGSVNLTPWSQSQNWFQRRTLDVYGFLLSIVFFLMIVFYILMRQVCLMILAFDEDEEESKSKHSSPQGSPKFKRPGKYIKQKYL
ncbi:unnamed protein product [Allacma fusca]|uniref:Glucuronosyltransferase n=1 Tax=Allacma fusca TaxID=39272 RepID=A0A8J2J8L7_9HEXA|nr:unnamed protein product [Allacma fusca]